MYDGRHVSVNLKLIGPCIIAIVDEWKTNLMSLAILYHLLCARHVSDINISIFRSLWLCWWITPSVVLFSVHCVLELLLRLVFGGVRFAGWSTVSGGFIAEGFVVCAQVWSIFLAATNLNMVGGNRYDTTVDKTGHGVPLQNINILVPRYAKCLNCKRIMWKIGGTLVL